MSAEFLENWFKWCFVVTKGNMRRVNDIILQGCFFMVDQWSLDLVFGQDECVQNLGFLDLS